MLCFFTDAVGETHSLPSTIRKLDRCINLANPKQVMEAIMHTQEHLLGFSLSEQGLSEQGLSHHLRLATTHFHITFLNKLDFALD